MARAAAAQREDETQVERRSEKMRNAPPVCNYVMNTGQLCGRLAVRATGFCPWHNPDPKCRHFNQTTGEPCINPARVGYTTCELHGTLTPLSKAKAKQRLQGLVEPALAALERAMEYGDWPVVVRAAQVILDRAGYGPQATLTVEDGTKQDLSELTDEELEARAKKVFETLRRGKAIQTQAEQHADRFFPAPVMEAEVVSAETQAPQGDDSADQ